MSNTPQLASATDETNCFHCALPIDDSNRVEKNIQRIVRHFCCHGCSSVCEIIHDTGLAGFYQRTAQGQTLSPPPEPPQDSELYDIDAIQSEFVQGITQDITQSITQTSGDPPGNEAAPNPQRRQIHLIIEGIHCSACVWLIERSLARAQGIVDIKVNLANKQAFISWDNSQTKVSSIIQHLGRIGYAATPFNPHNAEGIIKKHNRALLLRMAFAAFSMMNLLWISIALYSGAHEGNFKNLFQWLGFALATPTLLYAGWPFLRGAWLSIRHLNPGMDLPIAIGAMATYSYSVFVTLSPSATGEVYYDTVVNFIFVILLGRFLEAKSKRHAICATQRLMELQPRVANIIRDNESHIVPIRALQINDKILIKPGEKIPVDGIIISGQSSVDEALLSGESAAVKKHTTDKVYAGTLNIDSALTARVSAILNHTALGQIIHLVEQAQASKAPIQCTADKIVPWFVGITLLLATITFIYWSGERFELALLAATSVLIITCPCAFGLATPMSVAVASGLAAQHGLLIKNAAVLEHLSAVRHFVFDKTGTLTEGKMRVQHIISHEDEDKHALLEKAAHLESLSEHPIAQAILAQAKQHNIKAQPEKVTHFHNHPGKGICGEINQQMLFMGNTRWLKENHITLQTEYLEQSSALEKKAISCIHIATETSHIGFIAISDSLRKDAKTLIANLRHSGIKLSLLSGDKQAVVEAVAHELGGMNVFAEVLPGGKDEVIQKLQRTGERIAMIGDGINDAPALTRADVSIAIGSGTDVSIASADIVLLNNELDKIRLATELSRRTLRTIRQNIALSIAYNIVMVPLAMMTLITPLFAAIAMPLSSLAVIANASRIRNLFKHQD
ncbi:Lead, cadmium, zinc and mercury transporting ATPase; Copper-translocating P-type ATPase [hydrothermal vent metagenome]|uniref:Lead, cadmium, zinc and mercury transporting ATPase Copper-translocating P-type ATPase n=1 Tax=hydrothermal vent metagenome TaxID=652676 RepID=A0A3B0XCT6_9ZZZZ